MGKDGTYSLFCNGLRNILSTYLQCELGPCEDVVTTPANLAQPQS